MRAAGSDIGNGQIVFAEKKRIDFVARPFPLLFVIFVPSVDPPPPMNTDY